MISPWFIYFVNLIPMVKSMVFLFLMTGAVIGIFYVISRDEEQKLSHWFKVGVSGWLVLGLLSVFIPSRETVVGMYIVSHIDINDINDVQEALKTDILEIIEAINK